MESNEDAISKRPIPPNLSVLDERENILDQIESNTVTVISGPTGCGKSTLIPQFILEYNETRRADVKIIVTQPRRMAAQSVARRVARNLGVRLGTIVGYKIGLDKENCSPGTLITFCTTGILKKMIIQSRCLTDYTHVILDEVHDRSQDMDFLLLLCKQFINTNSRGVKLIMMSATLDCSKLLNYFQNAVSHVIRSTTTFPITEFFLDDFNINFQNPEPNLHDPAVKVCLDIIQSLKDPKVDGDNGAVLVFLPGESEIKTIKEALEAKREFKDQKWWILCLHSRIPLEESQKVFRNKRGMRKIVLSTNIAESSLTIPDVEVVIDFCLTKNLNSDPLSNYVKLNLEWADGNSAVQRKGRCGRTCEGKLYRLVTRMFFYQTIENSRHLPEILRAPLEKVVLDAKQLGLATPREILSLALDPPALENISQAIRLLKEIGALVTAVGKETEDDGDLTVLGEILSCLPIDLRLGKLVVLGYLLGVMEEAIIIAAGLSSKSLFIFSFSNRLNCYAKKLTWANESSSDCFAILNAYNAWKNHSANNFNQKAIGGFEAAEKNWCRSRYLEIKALKEVDVLIGEIKMSLTRLKIEEHLLPKNSTKFQTDLFLQIAIFGAFYPHYLYRKGSNIGPMEVFRFCDGYPKDTTIHLKGMPQDQIRYFFLYEDQLKKIFSDICGCNENSIKVTNTESKIFLTFDSDFLFPNPQFEEKVYFALKARLLRQPEICIKAYPFDVARNISESMDTLAKKNFSKKDFLALENIGQVELDLDSENLQVLFIINIENPNNFWAIRFVDHEKRELLSTSLQMMKEKNVGTFAKRSVVLQKSHLCIVEHEGSLWRARPIVALNDQLIKVRLIDSGISASLSVDKIRILTNEDVSQFPDIFSIPALAVNCSLANVKPNEGRQIQSDKSWDVQSIEAFKDLIQFRESVSSVWAKATGLVARDLDSLTYVELFPFKDRYFSLNFEYLESLDREGIPFAVIGRDAHFPLNTIRDSYSKSSRPISDGKSPTVPISLKGPFHPFEAKFRPVTNISRDREAWIEPDSVNSILIDRFPSSSIDQWVACSHLTKNEKGNTLTGRSTTCMPTIRSLGPILIMAFAPKVEMRVDRNKNCYTGCVAGLGPRTKKISPFNKQLQFSYPHDIELAFDLMFDNDDIKNINQIRATISECLSRPGKTNVGQDEAIALDVGAMSVKNTLLLRNLLKTMLFKIRPLKTVENFPFPYKWGKLPPSDFLVSSCSPSNEKNFLSSIQIINIKNDAFVKLRSQVANLKELEKCIERQSLNKPVLCPICPSTESLTSSLDISNHFKSLIHQENKQNLGKKIRDLS